MEKMVLYLLIIITLLILIVRFWTTAKDSKNGIAYISVFFIVLIPVVGCVIALMIFLKGKKKGEGKEEDTEEPLPDTIETDHELIEAFETVPVEEALFLNNPDIRKKMIMNIIYEDPEEYLEVLNLARINDDTEVVHYASAALMEQYQEKEKELKELEKKYLEDTTDPKRITAMVNKIRKYLDEGVIYGALKDYWANYAISLLREKLRLEKHIDDYNYMIHLLISQKNRTLALEILNDMNDRWGESEITLSCRMDYWIAEGNQTELKKVLLDILELKKEKKFISKELENDLNFWSVQSS